MSSAPRVGPLAAATAPIAPQAPSAADLRSGGNSGRSKASDVGTTRAAKTACSARAAMSMPVPCASPQAAEVTAKPSSPAMNSRRRPNWSASRPAGTSRAANTSE